jgi:hypothetical protein
VPQKDYYGADQGDPAGENAGHAHSFPPVARIQVTLGNLGWVSMDAASTHADRPANEYDHGKL